MITSQINFRNIVLCTIDYMDSIHSTEPPFTLIKTGAADDAILDRPRIESNWFLANIEITFSICSD